VTIAEFLKYLHDHAATRSLGESLSEILTSRGARAPIPARVADRDRVAS
jgi:hypothetical protein